MAQPLTEILVVDDAEALAHAAADEVARCAEAAVRARGRFMLALSGGSTPQRLYRLLADREAPFCEWIGATHLFWSDERHVPPDHPDSNYRMVREALLDAVLPPIPADNIHRIPAELPDAAQAADAYENELRRCFALAPGEVPRFDLMLLGLGADGHTASLFPGSDALHEREHLAVAVWVDKLSAFRITLTPPVFERAAEALFLVSGAGKAAALHAVLRSEHDPDRYPAQIVRPHDGRLLWSADRTAASRLEKPEL